MVNGLQCLSRNTTPSRGCRVYLSQINTSITSASHYDVDFDSEVYDTDSIHDTVTNNTRLTVPTGVTKVRLTANVHMQLSATATKFLEVTITKNGSSAFNMARAVALMPDVSNGTGLCITTGILTAVATDYYEITVWHNEGSALNLLGGDVYSSWFELEIIE